MEPKNHKVIRKFISDSERLEIADWILAAKHDGAPKNYHLDVLSEALAGKSLIFDISKTAETRYITEFQSTSNVSKESLPIKILDLLEKITNRLDLSADHVFLQAVNMNAGGRVLPHYDASVDGFINYKCNLSIVAQDYDIFIDESSERISEGDLYCFEASLYKHWTNEFASRRAFLSFGFLMPYSDLGRSEHDPRIRLSKRIEKYFQRRT